MDFTHAHPTEAYEDNEAATNSITSHRITPHLRHIDINLCYTHEEHAKGTFYIIKTPSRIQLADTGTKPESSAALLRITSIEMGHMQIKDLPASQFQSFSAPAQMSFYKHYCRTN